MKSLGASIALIFALTSTVSVAQRLKKADRLILSNFKSHVHALSSADNGNPASDYAVKQFKNYGLKPKGDSGSWYQRFEIYDGKQIQKGNYFIINNQELALYKDYFPFAFSASKAAEASVAIALAENGYPWFKSLQDLRGGADSGAAITELVHDKAKVAAAKGAKALIIYNTSEQDLVYDSMDRSQPAAIPVIFIKKQAFKRYCGDESATVDVKLNVSVKESTLASDNIIAFDDNGADSTVWVTASMGDKEGVAALLETARLASNIKKSRNNYLFVLWPEGKNADGGRQYFNEHAPVDMQKVNDTIKLEGVDNNNVLSVVKQNVE